MTDQKLQELLKGLTLKQKIGQMVQLNSGFFDESAGTVVTGPAAEIGLDPAYNVYDTGSILNTFDAAKLYSLQEQYLKNASHGIPLLFFGDIIHGYSTIFPIPLAQGCSWNPEAIERGAAISAAEMTAMGVHSTFAPMLDVVRDPRWGRVMESAGECGFVNSFYGRNSVKGFQAAGKEGPIEQGRAAACVKHFAAYGLPEGGREYAGVDMSEHRFYEDYLPGYRAAIDEGARLVMTSFNTLNGDPATGNEWLNRDVLRRDCAFNGVLISDHSAILELVNHGVAADARDAARLAVVAGVDIDMMTACYANHLEALVNEGVVAEALVDEAALRILRLKNDLGLFEDPFRGLAPEKAKAALLTDAAKQAAAEMAEQGAVLLKNENAALPIAKGKKIALIGPYAKSQATNSMWSFTGDMAQNITLEAGLAGVYGAENVTAVHGSPIVDGYEEFGELGGFIQMMAPQLPPAEELLAEAVKTAKEADVVVLAVGEHIIHSGEGAARTKLCLPAPQQKLVDAIAATGKQVVMVVYAGRPLILTGLQEQADAVLYAWLPGTMGGTALANLLSGRVSPSGRLTITFPRSEGQIPVYHSMLPTGRPLDPEKPKSRFLSHYLDEDNAPLYPFGYGLTYTTVEYRGIALDKAEIGPGGSLTASVTVKNTGSVDADEVVQLYLNDPVATLSRPVKEIKAFARVSLKAGEEKTVTLSITEEMLRFYHRGLAHTAEPGAFHVLVGPNAGDTPLQATFTYKA